METSRSSRGSSSSTSYQSFHDIELFEPSSPPSSTTTTAVRAPAPLPLQTIRGKQQQKKMNESAKEQQQRRTSGGGGMRMQRQDSGYESLSSPRTSTSHFRPSAARRPSNASSNGRPRTRPSIHRSAKTHPQYAAATRTSNQSLHLVRVNPPPQQFAFFQFPSPDAMELSETTRTSMASDRSRAVAEDVENLPPPLPPQPTHYWTSDRTRRLEYAAIDAATRGVKGWVMRNLVPECFVPKENRHVSFDDDTGSVRRYRLDLEEDEDDEACQEDEKKHKKNNNNNCNSEGRRRKGWFWGGRKNSV